MKKSKKLLIILAGMLVLSSCTVAPLTGRRQLKLVSDESVVNSSVSQYRQFINEASNKGLVVNNTPDGRREGAPFGPGANPIHGRDTHRSFSSIKFINKNTI